MIRHQYLECGRYIAIIKILDLLFLDFLVKQIHFLVLRINIHCFDISLYLIFNAHNLFLQAQFNSKLQKLYYSTSLTTFVTQSSHIGFHGDVVQ